MNNTSDVIPLTVAFAVILAVTWLIKRWTPKFNFGVVGLVMILVPAALRFERHVFDWYNAASLVIGVLILAADAAGRIGRRRS